MVYVITIGIEALFLVFLIAIFGSVYRARKRGAPFYPTSTNGIRNALTAVALRPGETFYDLGAGTGKALLIAEKEFGARAVGFELSAVFYLIGKINLFAHRSRAKLFNMDLFNADVKDADVVFCFLAIRTMQKMEDTLKAGCKPGTRIIVYAFPLPTMVPVRTIPVHGKWKMFIYRAG